MQSLHYTSNFLFTCNNAVNTMFMTAIQKIRIAEVYQGIGWGEGGGGVRGILLQRLLIGLKQLISFKCYQRMAN